MRLFGIFLVCLPHTKFCIVYQFLLSFPFVQHANVSLWLESIQAHLPANLSHILQSVIISDAIILSPSVQLPFLCVLKWSMGDLFALSLPPSFCFRNDCCVLPAVNCTYHCGISLHLEPQALFFHVLTVPLPENTIVPIGLLPQMPLALLPSQLLTDVGDDGALETFSISAPAAANLAIKAYGHLLKPAIKNQVHCFRNSILSQHYKLCAHVTS